MEFTEQNINKFHLATGTFISGKIFTEYLFLLKEELNSGNRGEKTIINRSAEVEGKAIRLIDALGLQLKAIGVDLKIPEDEVTKIQDIFYELLQLDETDQKRVNGLIAKIKREKNYEHDNQVSTL